MSPTEPAAREPRLYRGISASDRRAQRRARLIEAGLEVFGTSGYASSSVRALSAQAKLNSRYFYESFAAREDLLEAVYVHVLGEIAAAVVQATAETENVEEQARAGLLAAFRILTEDRRKARVVALEVVGVSERLERLRRQNRHAFADMLARNALSLAPAGVRLRLDPTLSARSMIGATMELLVDWINDDLDASVEELVDHLTRLFAAVALAAVARPDAQGARRGRPRAQSPRPAAQRSRPAAQSSQ